MKAKWIVNGAPVDLILTPKKSKKTKKRKIIAGANRGYWDNKEITLPPDSRLEIIERRGHRSLVECQCGSQQWVNNTKLVRGLPKSCHPCSIAIRKGAVILKEVTHAGEVMPLEKFKRLYVPNFRETGIRKMIQKENMTTDQIIDLHSDLFFRQ